MWNGNFSNQFLVTALSSVAATVVVLLFLQTLNVDQMIEIVRFLPAGALLWVGLFGLLEHKQQNRRPAA